MNKHFNIGILLCSFTICQLNAQRQIQTDSTIKKEITRDIYGTPINKNFKGAVIFDGKLLENGLESVSATTIDSIKTITYISPNNVPDSLINLVVDCQNGILILDTSSNIPPLSINSEHLENILMNYRAIFNDDISTEPY